MRWSHRRVPSRVLVESIGYLHDLQCASFAFSLSTRLPYAKQWSYFAFLPVPLMIGDGHTPAQPHSDPPRSSSTHDEPATPTARPTLLVLRHALASSRRAIEAARYPRSATIHIGSVGLLHDSQRQRLRSHCLQP